MKKIIALTLAIMLMVCCLAGCGAKAPAEEVSENIFVETQETGAESPEEKAFLEKENYGVPVIAYAGTTIPAGLGLPKLSDGEIDALLAENDPRKVKETKAAKDTKDETSA